jgi:hypothetical protein
MNMQSLDATDIAEIRGDLLALAMTLDRGGHGESERAPGVEEDESDARAALASQILQDLQRHREVFNPARFRVERHRMSVTQGSATLSYMSDDGVELWRCAFADDIRVTVVTEDAERLATGTQNPQIRVCSPEEAEARGRAFENYTGTSLAEFEALGRRVFVHGFPQAGVAHAHGLRTRDDAALMGAARTLCAQAHAFGGDTEVADVTQELEATLDRLSRKLGWIKPTPKLRRMEAM